MKTLNDIAEEPIESDVSGTIHRVHVGDLKHLIIERIKEHFKQDWDCHFGFNPMNCVNKNTWENKTFIDRYGDGKKRNEYGNHHKDFCVGWNLIKIFNITKEELEDGK